MEKNRPVPPYPEHLTVAVTGKRVQLKNIIGNMILGKEAFTRASQELAIEGNNSFTVVVAPDFFDEVNLYEDQNLIDFMAAAYPGPHLFLLVIDSENNQKDKVMAQVRKLQGIFGDTVTAYLAIILPEVESFVALSQSLKDHFHIWLANSESLARECRKACCGSQPFLFDFTNYSQQVVLRRKAVTEGRLAGQSMPHREREDAGLTNPPPQQQAAATPAQPRIQQNKEKTFHIVLLGLTGTGKSASANTILLAGDPDLKPAQLFKSESSSVPITTECSFKVLEKPFGVPVYVVDTPDFFHEEIKDCQRQLAKCKRYCQPGQCVVLLVMQLGRTTDREKDILEKLENLLGWRIRECTIVLLTHKEDLTEGLKEHVQNDVDLGAVVAKCGWQFHAFSNNGKDSRQVAALFRKIQVRFNYFPKFTRRPDCCVC